MNKQLDFLDLLNIMSFYIGLMNLQENVTQGDIQEVMKELANEADRLLTEIHEHLEDQDNKLNIILQSLSREE